MNRSANGLPSPLGMLLLPSVLNRAWAFRARDQRCSRSIGMAKGKHSETLRGTSACLPKHVCVGQATGFKSVCAGDTF